MSPVRQPLVSVVTTTWNAADYLRETLESALSQTYERLEIVVVDDGSTDHTPEVCTAFGDRIRYIRQPKDAMGGSTAVVRAFQEAKGDYLATLDHDDRWYPIKIERQVEAMLTHPEAGAVFTDFVEIDSVGAVRGPSELVGLSGDVFHALLARNRYCYSSALLSRTAIEVSGGPKVFDDGIGLGDWDLWLRIGRHFPMIMINEVLTEYRVHERSYSADRRRMAKATVNVLNRNRANLHPNCAECRRAFASSMSLAAHAYLEHFHKHARAGELRAALPSLKDAIATAPAEVFAAREIAGIGKSLVLAAAR
jgi:glycosyltransferase involved in cell wall biosynthesis